MPYSVPSIARPFTLSIPDDDYSQFRAVLQVTRSGPETWENQHKDGRYGIPHQWLTSTRRYWLTDFNCRAQEDRINALPNFKILVPDETDKENIDLHFVGLFSEREDAYPIVLIHGWPGSFLEFMPVLEIVQQKYSPSELPYHFIVPSLPGYLFSSGPGQAQAYTSQDAARVINKAMIALGFSRYAVQGGDVGSLIASILATNYDSVAAIHLNLLPSLEMPSVDDPSLSSKDKEAIEMGEKFLEWPDDPIGIDELLTNVTLYWLTDTMPRCIYTYRGTFIDSHQYSFPAFRQPFGYSWFMKELVPVPQKLARKHGNLVFYRQHENGGHFAAFERPIEFLHDIEDFMRAAGF
ncbi:putative epoxide hydrolase [Colletotrichum aenigma]|uniref:putative epoxide hydrolase n=1 Tax=Colletotrichum aenigma TaxID=1215731 RepID=UPI001872B141|nr:putative epoxide hydrolase [Colletotrichum aenigma]KAF5485431.1 putative epoxide hydrolase [Colletotrichum aenigma]